VELTLNVVTEYRFGYWRFETNGLNPSSIKRGNEAKIDRERDFYIHETFFVVKRLLKKCLTPMKRILLNPWNRVLPKKLTVPQVVKKFPALYRTQRFITVFTSAHHLSLS